MKKLKLGIVGCGMLSQTVHIPCFYKNKKSEIVALCDRNKYLLSALSLKYKINKTYTSINKMIKNENLNAIILTVQRPSTYKISKKILEAGINLFVEKPMAIKLDQAKELEKIKRKKKLKYIIAYMKRSDDAVEYFKKILKKKKYQYPKNVVYNSFMGIPKPVTNNFIPHENKLRRKKYSLNKNFKNKKKVYEKYLNAQCHSINLIKHLLGKIFFEKALISKNGEGSVFFNNYRKVNIQLKNKFLKSRNSNETVELFYLNHYLKLVLQNPFNKNSKSKVILKDSFKKKSIIKKFKNWSFMNQSKNFIDYLKNNKINVLSDSNEGLEDIRIINQVFKEKLI